MKLLAAVLLLLTILMPPALAKGDTVKIAIESATLPAPIQITDPAVRQFNIWAGPGTSTFDGSQGFIIDWPNRADAAPVGFTTTKYPFMRVAT